MIQLSYSTLNMIYQSSHNWLNKQMGIKPEERPEWEVGKKIHRIIQDHVSGKKLHLNLKHIKHTFPVVEEVDFDERCKFNFDCNFAGKDIKNKYNIIGFIDGLDPENKRFLEIKSSDPLWSVGKFQNTMQRKVYALAKPEFTEAVLITCTKKIENWDRVPAKIFKVPLTDQDRKEARDWILGGIRIIESGEFTGGLDENGKCTNPWCYFGKNCQFK